MATHSGSKAAPVGGTIRRWARWGFLVGVVVAVVATFLALALPAAEGLHPFLVPATTLLAPLRGQLETWPALLSVGLGALLNGVVYAAGAAALGAVAGLRRR